MKIEIELSDQGYERLKIAAKNWKKNKGTEQTPEQAATYMVCSGLALLWLAEKAGEEHEKTNKN